MRAVKVWKGESEFWPLLQRKGCRETAKTGVSGYEESRRLLDVFFRLVMKLVGYPMRKESYWFGLVFRSTERRHSLVRCVMVAFDLTASDIVVLVILFARYCVDVCVRGSAGIDMVIAFSTYCPRDPIGFLQSDLRGNDFRSVTMVLASRTGGYSLVKTHRFHCPQPDLCPHSCGLV